MEEARSGDFARKKSVEREKISMRRRRSQKIRGGILRRKNKGEMRGEEDEESEERKVGGEKVVRKADR